MVEAIASETREHLKRVDSTGALAAMYDPDVSGETYVSKEKNADLHRQVEQFLGGLGLEAPDVAAVVEAIDVYAYDEALADDGVIPTRELELALASCFGVPESATKDAESAIESAAAHYSWDDHDVEAAIVLCADAFDISLGALFADIESTKAQIKKEAEGARELEALVGNPIRPLEDIVSDAIDRTAPSLWFGYEEGQMAAADVIERLPDDFEACLYDTTVSRVVLCADLYEALKSAYLSAVLEDPDPADTAIFRVYARLEELQEASGIPGYRAVDVLGYNMLEKLVALGYLRDDIEDLSREDEQAAIRAVEYAWSLFESAYSLRSANVTLETMRSSDWLANYLLDDCGLSFPRMMTSADGDDLVIVCKTVDPAIRNLQKALAGVEIDDLAVEYVPDDEPAFESDALHAAMSTLSRFVDGIDSYEAAEWFRLNPGIVESLASVDGAPLDQVEPPESKLFFQSDSRIAPAAREFFDLDSLPLERIAEKAFEGFDDGEVIDAANPSPVVRLRRVPTVDEVRDLVLRGIRKIDPPAPIGWFDFPYTVAKNDGLRGFPSREYVECFDDLFYFITEKIVGSPTSLLAVHAVDYSSEQSDPAKDTADRIVRAFKFRPPVIIENVRGGKEKSEKKKLNLRNIVDAMMGR